MVALNPRQPARSLATGQVAVGPSRVRYPLWPVRLHVSHGNGPDAGAYPVEVDYDYERVPPELFDVPAVPPFDHWAALLPPLDRGLYLGEGGTPLIPWHDTAAANVPVFIKDESQNPTWSHKDRLNRCAVSAAVLAGSPGIVVASSGTHGASAAAYAARAGLPCIVVTSETTSLATQNWLRSYGAAVLRTSRENRWALTRRIADRWGYHPVSNVTQGGHTGHPFGPEGYKTLAYELYLQLNRQAPAAVFLPTGYGELLFGVWKGFAELARLGLIASVPRLFACEPELRAPLSRALESGNPIVTVPPAPTQATSIATTINSYRGVIAVQASHGRAIRVSDEEMIRAQERLARAGLWVELSAAASLAGLWSAMAAGETFDGPVICICTSSGLKGHNRGLPPGAGQPAPLVENDWAAVGRVLNACYGIRPEEV